MNQSIIPAKVAQCEKMTKIEHFGYHQHVGIISAHGMNEYFLHFKSLFYFFCQCEAKFNMNSCCKGRDYESSSAKYHVTEKFEN